MNMRPFTPALLARRWGCSTTLVYDLLNAGQLKGFRLGKLWRIAAASVEAFETHSGSGGTCSDQDVPGAVHDLQSSF